jgi:hypothetical protein
MYAIKHRYESRRHTPDLLAFRFCVALPYLTRTEWENRGFGKLVGSGPLIFRQELGPVRIKAGLERVAADLRQKELNDGQWE